MATLSRTATLPDSSAKSDFYNLIDTATVTGIVNADVSAGAAIVASKLDLSTVAQTIAMSSKAINFAQGSDIASAGTTDIGAAVGNYVHITGTTGITALGTVQAGTIRYVKFSGALIITHNAASLILPNNASNITTAANDRAIFASLGSGNWVCLLYQKADGTALAATTYTPTAANALSGSVIQTVNNVAASNFGPSANLAFGAVATGTTTVPDDDTIPQNTEGTQFMQLAITPNNASNLLKFEINIIGGEASNQVNIVSLHQDATANALASVRVPGGAGTNNQSSMIYYMTAGTTSPTTFKVRAGMANAGTWTFNGVTSARKLGGVMASSMTITEIKA